MSTALMGTALTSRNTPPSTSLKRLYRACSCPCCCCMAVDCDGEEAAMLGEEASVHAEWQGAATPSDLPC